MRFYIINDTQTWENGGCYLKREDAIEAGRSMYNGDEFDLTTVDCEVNAETIRRLLGDEGGYARKTTTITIKTEED